MILGGIKKTPKYQNTAVGPEGNYQDPKPKVRMGFKQDSRLSKECFKGCSRNFLLCVKKNFRVFQGRFKGVYMVF